MTDRELCEMLAACVSNTMLDFERGCSLACLVLECQRVEGDMVEFGAYTGQAAMLMSSLCNKTLWVYDSFRGLPPKRAIDGNDARFYEGVLAVGKDVLIRNFAAAGLATPCIIEKWFGQLTDNELPNRIAFAHLDGDFYESIFDSLKLVYQRMTPGGIVLIDDYNHRGLPGVRVAVSDFLKDKPESVICPAGGKGPEGVMLHAYFIKH
jgi:O-methyltransferase